MCGELADAIQDMENLLDQLFDRSGKINGLLVRVRREQGISAVVAGAVHRDFAEVGASIANAQVAAGRGHGRIARLAQQFGIDISMFGDGRKPADGAATVFVGP